MKNKLSITGIIMGIIITIIGIILKFKRPLQMSFSLPINFISSSDGPTSVFIAGKLGPDISLIVLGIGIVILVISTTALFVKKK